MIRPRSPKTEERSGTRTVLAAGGSRAGNRTREHDQRMLQNALSRGGRAAGSSNRAARRGRLAEQSSSRRERGRAVDGGPADAGDRHHDPRRGGGSTGSSSSSSSSPSSEESDGRRGAGGGRRGAGGSRRSGRARSRRARREDKELDAKTSTLLSASESSDERGGGLIHRTVGLGAAADTATPAKDSEESEKLLGDTDADLAGLELEQKLTKKRSPSLALGAVDSSGKAKLEARYVEVLVWDVVVCFP